MHPQQQLPPHRQAARPAPAGRRGNRGAVKWIIALLSLALIGTAGLLAPKAFAASKVDTSSNSAFIKSIAPLAQASQKKYGVPASVAMAQAILESGWGKSSLTKKGNAFFGIKCSAKSKYANGCMNMRTREVYNGKDAYIKAGFRTYSKAQNSFYDHGLFLQTNSRYSKAFKYEKSPNKFIREVHKAGYATDPNYTKLIVGIMKSNNLYKYDKPSGSKATKKPTKKPSKKASKKASTKPSKKASGKSTAKPSAKATTKPSGKKSAKPSSKATAKPSGKKSAKPSAKATAKPSSKATAKPTRTSTTPSRTAAPRTTAAPTQAPTTTVPVQTEPVETEVPVESEPVDAPVQVIEADPAKEGVTYPTDDGSGSLPMAETVSKSGSTGGQSLDAAPQAPARGLPSTGL